MAQRFEETTLTPELAEKLLQGNTGNRKLDKAKVAQWTREIEHLRWRLTNETIAIAKDGRVVDGQHRLHAVVKAQKPIRVVICWDADPDTFGVINIGKVRTGNDIWGIAGHTSTNAAASAKLVYLYENHRQDADWHNKGRLSADLILRWCQQQDIVDVISRAAYRERDFGKQIKSVGACVGASLSLIEIHSKGRLTCDEVYKKVFEPVVTCLGLQEGMPSYVLNRILNNRDSKSGKEAGNPFRTGIFGPNVQRSRLGILLRVILDTYNNVERKVYPFDAPALPTIATALPNYALGSATAGRGFNG